MKRFVIGTALFSFLVVSGCIAGKTSTEINANESEVQRTRPNFPDEIKVAVGQEFAIKIEGNPSTGYDWQIAKLDESLLKVKSEDFVVNSPDGIVGASGTRIFNLLALKAGESELTLNYKRAFADDVLKSKTYKITIAAAANDEAQPTLVCQLNRSQSIALFVKDEKVLLNQFPATKTQLEISRFNFLRCPNCYSFDGKAGELRIVGLTRMEFQGNNAVTLLSAEINGKKQPDAVCTVPSAN